MKKELRERFHTGFHNIVYQLDGNTIVQRKVSSLIHKYTSGSTIVLDLHSGLAAETRKLISEEHLSPLNALVKAKENKIQRSLTPSEKTNLMVNTALLGFIDLGARRVLKNSAINRRFGPLVRRKAKELYKRADWNESADSQNELIRNKWEIVAGDEDEATTEAFREAASTVDRMREKYPKIGAVFNKGFYGLSKEERLLVCGTIFQESRNAAKRYGTTPESVVYLFSINYGTGKKIMSYWYNQEQD